MFFKILIQQIIFYLHNIADITYTVKRNLNFNLTRSIKFNELVHETKINILCTVNLQIFGKINTSCIKIKENLH